MKKPALVELRGRSADWVTAERGLSNVPKNVRSLVVDRKIVGTLEPLTKLTGMRQLFVQGVRKQDMPILGSLRQLRSLLIWRLDATDLHEIRALDSLRDFGVYHAPKLETLKGIEHWKLLKNFFLHNTPRLRSVAHMETLPSVQEIVIQNGWSASKLIKVKSFRPLSSLLTLKRLDLRGVEATDESLDSLSGLKSLRHFFPGTYNADVEKLAFLAAKLNPQLVRDDRISHIKEYDSDSFICKKCRSKQHQLIGRSGSRYRPFACPNCDSDLIQSRLEIFLNAKGRNKTKER
jgi:hypothetical protein